MSKFLLILLTISIAVSLSLGAKVRKSDSESDESDENNFSGGSEEKSGGQFFQTGAEMPQEWVPPDHQHLAQPPKYQESPPIGKAPFSLALVLIAISLLAFFAPPVPGNQFSQSKSKSGSCPNLLQDEVNKIVEADQLFMADPHPLQAQINNMFLEGNYFPHLEHNDMARVVARVDEMCGKDAFFYTQNANFMNATMMLKQALLQIPDPMDMLFTAMRMKPQLNTKLWFTALMHAKHSRADMAGMTLPCPMDTMPDLFVSGLLDQIMEQKQGHECIQQNQLVGKDNGVENKLWYFREDLMVNSFHFYWHMNWPIVTRGKMTMDRRGELFYFTHRSLLMRYNIERITNGLGLAEPLNYEEALLPAYNPHLKDYHSGLEWTPRSESTYAQDIDHSRNPYDNAVIRQSDWTMKKNRIFQAIDSGMWRMPGGRVQRITEKTGIDELGNTLEAADISINPNYYGVEGYHNDGHKILGSVSDPDFKKMLTPGVMADPATALRDPIFYRYHTNINNMFDRYKKTLKPYDISGGPHALNWPAIEIKSVKVVSDSGRVNKVQTFFTERNFPLTMDLAFNTKDWDVEVCSEHLDHEEFTYEFEVYSSPCNKKRSKTATFRVFLAPRYDHTGRRFTVHEQRKLFVHLDLFNVKVPPGRSTIRRSSLSSSLTTPHQETLSQLIHKDHGSTENCGCGWPHHLLLPKGSEKGTEFDLFVMATNGDEWVQNHGSGGCGKAFIFCGLSGQQYPDKKPMGYPFDRFIVRKRSNCGQDDGSIWFKLCSALGGWRSIIWLEEWVHGVGNIGVGKLLVIHK